MVSDNKFVLSNCGIYPVLWLGCSGMFYDICSSSFTQHKIVKRKIFTMALPKDKSNPVLHTLVFNVYILLLYIIK